MLPKRKLIKKRHRRQQEENNNGTNQPTGLIQKLHSGDPSLIEEALVYISSMCVLEDSPELVAMMAQLITVLYKGQPGNVYQCLYAITNLVELEPRVVPKLFQLGLAKALVQLNSGDAQLLKPILSLMASLHGLLPQEFKYLLKGVQQSLNVVHLQSNSKSQVLTFLMQIQSSTLSEQLYQKIYQMFKNQNQLQIRSLCAAIIMRNTVIRNKVVKEMLDYCQEIFCDIDLEKEYQTNIVKVKPVVKSKEIQTQMMEQEEEVVVPSVHPNFQTFSDAVEGVETLMEVLLILFEELQGDQTEMQEEEYEGQEWGNQNLMQTQQSITQFFTNFLTQKVGFISRNTVLTFSEGQNIVHLALRVLGVCKSLDKQNLAIVTVKCLQNMLQVKPPAYIEEQILVVSLHLLMKCPLPHYARNLMLEIGQKVLKVTRDHKDCWMRLLQVYSIHFNPEKGQVSVEQNRRVGAILKNLIINIPELNLEEWRAQTIDTVFDVFSNQNFDAYLVELGVLGLLEKVLTHAQGKKKFIRDVVTDIKRFLDYKRKMIKF